MPTAAERDGDFSKSVTGSGTPIEITDPPNGVQFPGNVVPKSRFSTSRPLHAEFPADPQLRRSDQREQLELQEHLHAAPIPSAKTWSASITTSRPRLQVYWRYVQDKDEQQVPYGLWVNGNVNYLVAPITFGQPGKGHVVHITKSITPTLVNEFIFGISQNKLYFYPTDASLIDRAKIGNPGQWYPDTTTGVSYFEPSELHAQPYVRRQPRQPRDRFVRQHSVRELQHRDELCGQRFQGDGRAQPESGSVYRAHREVPGGRHESARCLQLQQHDHQPVRFRRRFFKRAAGRDQDLLGRYRARERRLDLQQPGILRSGQLARQQAPDPRPRHALLSPAAADRHQPDHRRFQPLAL